MSTGVAAPAPSAGKVRSNGLRLRWRMAANSRASPRWPHKSGRCVRDLLSISMIQSSRPSSFDTGEPGLVDRGNSQMPLCSSPRPSSRSEQIMPHDSTPRILLFLMCTSPGSLVPGKATATCKPARTLGAPHTICCGSARPTSTLQTDSLSASGCFSRSSTCPTTTASKCGKKRSTPSTSAVESVKSWATS